jgi:hypothetical protein
MKPNLFKIATKELSHDAFFTWLLQWSHPGCKEEGLELHTLATAFLALLLKDNFNLANTKMENIKAGRQWDNIDIWAHISLQDQTKILLIIEDKTFTSEHSDQLERYKKNALQWCSENNAELVCIFLKIGSEPVNVLNKITAKGFKVIDRRALLELFTTHQCNHPLVNDYREYLQTLHDAHLAYADIPPAQWNDLAWIGLYQLIETEVSIITWHYVNNPSGGFWNLCLTWEYWDAFPVYMQVEQGRLAFKLAVSEDETGYKPGEIDTYKVQDFISDHILSFAKQQNRMDIEKPYPYVHRGNYRTIALIKRENWLGASDTQVTPESVIIFLKELISFYHSLLENLNQFSINDVN